MIITLRMTQLQCLVDDTLPTDFSSILVFTRSGLKSLDARTDTLKKVCCDDVWFVKPCREDCLTEPARGSAIDRRMWR